MSKYLFLFYLIDEMSEWPLKAKIGTETSGLWPRKTGACLKEVHLHVKSIGGVGGGGMKMLA